jgi:ribonuclease BN (tRNA processing enzyme)
LLFDIGDGIVRDLVGFKMDFPIKKTIHVFITHGHYDHCGGLFSFLGFLRMTGHTHPVNIYAPEKCLEVKNIIKSFSNIYKSTVPYPLESIFLVAGLSIKLTENIEIKCYQMKHRGSIINLGPLAPIPALGYAIFKKQEKWLSCTGDTGYDIEVERLVKDSNFAYIEATNRSKSISSYHLSPEEAHKLGRLAKDYTLIHKRYDSR